MGRLNLVLQPARKTTTNGVVHCSRQRLTENLNCRTSEKHLEPRRLEMFVVSEGFRDCKALHHEKRNVVDNSRVAGLATLIRRPCLEPFCIGGRDQFITQFEGITQVANILAECAPRRGVTAFQ